MSRAPHPHRDLAEYGTLLCRHKVLTVFSLLAGLSVSAVLFALTPPTYIATAQVLVTPTGVQDQTNQITPRQREPLNLDTEAQIAQSSVVARKAAEELGTQDADAVRRRITVNVPPNSAILSISFESSRPDNAAAGAQAIATAYLANRAATATQVLDGQLKLVNSTLRDVKKNLGEVVVTLPRLPNGSADRLIATQRQNALSRQVYNLTVRYDSLRTIAVTPGSVISDARPPGHPSRPVLPLFIGSGLFLGLIIGTGAAFLRDRQMARPAHA